MSILFWTYLYENADSFNKILRTEYPQLSDESIKEIIRSLDICSYGSATNEINNFDIKILEKSKDEKKIIICVEFNDSTVTRVI